MIFRGNIDGFSGGEKFSWETNRGWVSKKEENGESACGILGELQGQVVACVKTVFLCLTLGLGRPLGRTPKAHSS